VDDRTEEAKMGFLKQLFSKKACAKGIVESNVKAYHNLKARFPGVEEHRVLANVWLARYPRGDETISLTETLQFSVLDPGENARALGLYLQYKEMPGYIVPELATEFTRYQAKIDDLVKSGRMVEAYRQKNPLTARENPWLVSTLEDIEKAGIESLAHEMETRR
jgi:hypothetical protein